MTTPLQIIAFTGSAGTGKDTATGAWATQIVLGPYQPTVQESLTE
jgi:hypothetical protein